MAKHIWKQFFHTKLPGHGDRNRFFTILSYKPCRNLILPNRRQKHVDSLLSLFLIRETERMGGHMLINKGKKIVMGVKQCTQDTRQQTFICLTPSAQTDTQQTPEFIPVTNNVKLSPNSLSNFIKSSFT